MDGVLARRRGDQQLVKLDGEVARALHEHGGLDLPFDGAAYGVALNARRELDTLADAFKTAPYKAPPKAPVLYVKTANTFALDGAVVPVPKGVTRLWARPSVAVVIGRTACRVSAAKAPDHIAGYSTVIDISLPHDSYFRPAIRELCRDGFLPMAPWATPAGLVPFPDTLLLDLEINSQRHGAISTAELVRTIPELLAQITDFMTLHPGDVVLTSPFPPVEVAPGDTLRAAAAPLAPTTCTLEGGLS